MFAFFLYITVRARVFTFSTTVRNTPTIRFGGNRYSISTFRAYCRIDGVLIMPRSYYNISRAYSSYTPETIGGTSLWASSGVSPDFSRKFCKQTILRLMRNGLHTVFVVAGTRLRRAGEFTLTSTLITSGYATVLMAMGSSTLCFRVTTFVVLGRFYQRCSGSLKVIEARFRLVFKRSYWRGHD